MPAVVSVQVKGAEPVANTPAQMAAQIKDDTVRYARLVKESNVTVD